MSSDCDIIVEDNTLVNGVNVAGQSITQEQVNALVVDGYYPLYTSQTQANSVMVNASGQLAGTSHTHTFNGTTYYMPDNLGTQGVDWFHGTFFAPYSITPDEMITEQCVNNVALASASFRTSESGPLFLETTDGLEGVVDFLKQLDPGITKPYALSELIDACVTLGVYKQDGSQFVGGPDYPPFELEVFYGMFFQLGPVITVEAGHVGWTDIGWNLSAEMEDGTEIPNEGVEYIYEVGDSATMQNVLYSESMTIIPDVFTYRNASADTDYWLRVRYVVTDIGRSSPGTTPVKNRTNPCDIFDVIDNGTSLRVQSQPGATVTIMQDHTSDNRLLGVTRRVMDDQFGNLYMTTSQGPVRDIDGNYDPTGRAVFDAGWPKFYSYKEFSDGTQYTGSSDENAGGTTQWTRTDRDRLLNGESIYNAEFFAGQFAYLYNAFNYVRRQPTSNNTLTNKLLYICDYAGYDSYSSHKWWSCVRDIGTAAGLTVEQLPTTTGTFTRYGPTYASESHYSAIIDSSKTQADWEAYFAQYDAIAWFGSNWSSNDYTLPNTLIQAFRTFFKNGGGLFASTDHNSFQKTVNRLIYPWFGVYYTGYINRTPGHPDYKISNVLSNTSYIPSGWHPLFDKLDPNSYIHAGGSEGAIVYDTSQSTTQTKTVPTGQNYVDFTIRQTGQVYVSTSNDCGAQITR